MAAGVYNLNIEQGATYRRTMTVKDEAGDPINFAGYTGRLQIRPEVESIIVYASLTTENGGLTLGASAGTVEIYMSAAETSDIPTEGVYDLEIEAAGGDVSRLLKGKVRLDPEVTRD